MPDRNASGNESPNVGCEHKRCQQKCKQISLIVPLFRFFLTACLRNPGPSSLPENLRREVPCPYEEAGRSSRGIVPYLLRHAEAETRFPMGQYGAYVADVQENEDVEKVFSVREESATERPSTHQA